VIIQIVSTKSIILIYGFTEVFFFLITCFLHKTVIKISNSYRYFVTGHESVNKITLSRFEEIETKGAKSGIF